MGVQSTGHFLLEQLKRDASKKGALQAKIALVNYYLNTKAIPRSAESDKIALKYLEEVITAHDKARSEGKISNPYASIARQLQYKLNNKDDATFNTIASSNQSNEGSELTRQLPVENQYKIARMQFSYGDTNNYTLEKYESTLKKLLKNIELTDTLRAKIYFQLVEINIEKAKNSGARVYVERAQDFCDILINDPALSSMIKADKARKILQKITESKVMEDFGVWDYLKDIFKTTQIDGSRTTFKWLGIVLGNIANLSLLPPLVNKATFDVGRYKNWDPAAGSFAKLIFKNSGFAWLFKNIGKVIGTYVVGPVIGLAVAALSIPFYPLVKVYQRYKTNNQISTLAGEIVNLKLESQPQPIFKKKNNSTALIDQKEVNELFTNERVKKTLLSYERVTLGFFPAPKIPSTTLEPTQPSMESTSFSCN